MSVVKPGCPVPPEQLPINQYQAMSQSWFYRWGSCGLWAYLKPLAMLWCSSWIVAGPVAAASFSPGKYPFSFGVWAAAGALILPTLTLLQLWVGWNHIGQRLKQQSVPYEESGWYDGQVWLKPEEIWNRDRLIMTYEVQPILSRVKLTVSILAATGIVLIVSQRIL